MDLTTSTKLMSTDNHDQSNPHGCQDITEGKESLLHGKLSSIPQNHDFSSHGGVTLGGYLRGLLINWSFNFFQNRSNFIYDQIVLFMLSVDSLC